MAIVESFGMGAFIQEDGTVLIGRDCPGVEIPEVSKIEVRIRAGEFVTALITVAVLPDTIQANPLLSFESLQRAAKAHGFHLVPMPHVEDVDLKTGIIHKSRPAIFKP